MIILLPVLFRYIKNRRQQKKELKRLPPTSIIVEAPYSPPPNLSPLNYTSYTHSLGFDGHPMESDSSPGIVRWTSNHEISDEQTMQEMGRNNILMGAKVGEKVEELEAKMKKLLADFHSLNPNEIEFDIQQES